MNVCVIVDGVIFKGLCITSTSTSTWENPVYMASGKYVPFPVITLETCGLVPATSKIVTSCIIFSPIISLSISCFTAFTITVEYPSNIHVWDYPVVVGLTLNVSVKNLKTLLHLIY